MFPLINISEPYTCRYGTERHIPTKRNIVSLTREYMKKIFQWLNLRPDENQKWTLGFRFFSGLLLKCVGPALLCELVKNVPSWWVALTNLLPAICGFIIATAWRGKFRRFVVKNFVTFCVIESVAGFTTAFILVFIHYNIWIYAIVSLIYVSTITELSEKGFSVIRSKLWCNKGREIFDNNTKTNESFIKIVGYSIALFLVALPIKVAISLWGIACLVDDIGWVIVYLKNKEIIREEEEE